MAIDTKIRFQPKQLFTDTLKARVDAYFTDNKISPHANGRMIAKTVAILSAWIGIYFTILFAPLPGWVLLLLAAVEGFTIAMIGFNIAHDALHGAYSKNKKVNSILGTLFNLVGANDYMWKIKHNVIHHTYTNIPGHDDDLEGLPGVRVCTSQPRKAMHQWQHIYVFFFYPLASIFWVLFKDYKKFATPQLGAYDNRKHPPREWVRLFAFKILYWILFLVVPILVLPFAWYWVLAGFMIMHAVQGTVMALVFQLAHLVEATDLPLPKPCGSMENSWAVHQLYTTANFSSQSAVAEFICGGLNMQVEHHLFPRVCHIHYRNLSPILKSTAEEYGIPYLENRTFFTALASHVRTLKSLGHATAVDHGHTAPVSFQ